MNMAATVFGFEYKSTQTRSEHLSKYYNNMCMFTVVMMCRIRFRHSFVEWSLISSMVSYGTSRKGSMFLITSFFGLTCSCSTLMDRLKEFRKPNAFYARMDSDVDKYGWIDYVEDEDAGGNGVTEGQHQRRRLHVSISMFDNSQRGVKHKYQTPGASSSMVRLTSLAYMKPWFGPWHLHSILTVDKQPY